MLTYRRVIVYNSLFAADHYLIKRELPASHLDITPEVQLTAAWGFSVFILSKALGECLLQNFVNSVQLQNAVLFRIRVGDQAAAASPSSASNAGIVLVVMVYDGCPSSAANRTSSLIYSCVSTILIMLSFGWWWKWQRCQTHNLIPWLIWRSCWGFSSHDYLPTDKRHWHYS